MKQLYKFAGLPFWSEQEIELREAFQLMAVASVKRTLTHVNPAWRYFRTEGPILTPSQFVSDEYSSDDVFETNHKAGGAQLTLRAETTASSYAFARTIQGKKPICVWQSGKSFRREINDGATAGKLRFNEFHQLEFQCIYRKDTKADYRQSLIAAIRKDVERITMCETRVVDSDRVPAYAQSTLDIEAKFRGKWREIASCSIRTDYDGDHFVCEVAIGLCRVALMAAE